MDIRRLLNEQPKPAGFQIVVPDPNSLYEWTRYTPNAAGDEIFREEEGVEVWGPQAEKRTKKWQARLDGTLFSDIGVQLRGGYGRKGPYAECSAEMNFTRLARDNRLTFEIAQRSSKIRTGLAKKGLRRIEEVIDPDGIRTLYIADKDDSVEAILHLGYESEDAALAAWRELFGEDPVDPDVLGGDFIEFALPYLGVDDVALFLRGLRHFSVVVSDGVGTIYEVLGQKAPSTTINLFV
ncbi:hypothetical protein HYW87_01060 [Candidatus Roizmanbacteria bacterium]|nr:hypothetical protein [Candidatus Roizmanbacteria bacterium]